MLLITKRSLIFYLLTIYVYWPLLGSLYIYSLVNQRYSLLTVWNTSQPLSHRGFNSASIDVWTVLSTPTLVSEGLQSPRAWASQFYVLLTSHVSFPVSATKLVDARYSPHHWQLHQLWHPCFKALTQWPSLPLPACDPQNHPPHSFLFFNCSP